MSTVKLTPAEKRKATLAAKAAKEQEDNVAFQNASRRSLMISFLPEKLTVAMSGKGRQAKQDANLKAGMCAIDIMLHRPGR